MIVLLTKDGQHLLQADDFKRFSLHCTEARPPHAPAPVDGIVFESADVAWIAVEHLVAIMGERASPEWRQEVRTMIEKVEGYGWVSPDRRQLRAHIEWTSPHQP